MGKIPIINNIKIIRGITMNNFHKVGFLNGVTSINYPPGTFNNKIVYLYTYTTTYIPHYIMGWSVF